MMTHTDKLLLLHEINFVNNAMEGLKLRTLEQVPDAIETLEEKIDQLWGTIEKITKGAREKEYNMQIKRRKFDRGCAFTIVPNVMPVRKKVRIEEARLLKLNR